MYMTEKEICRDYRNARNRGVQIQILADRNVTSMENIIKILLRNGEQVRIPLPSRGKPRKREMTDKEYYAALFKRLDVLDEQMAKAESEYRAIAAVIKGAKYA